MITTTIKIRWEDTYLEIPVFENCVVQYLEPSYPMAISDRMLESAVKKNLVSVKEAIVSAKKIVIITEDSTRATLIGPLVAILVRELADLRGANRGIKIIVAAGAHCNLSRTALAQKIGEPNIPVIIHDCTDQNRLSLIGYSKSGIPLWFNRLVVEADLRLTISTVNIHPMVGFSGGGKILLPGVAGLETITAFHSLPQGYPGVYQNEMRSLINEILPYLPIGFSWQLLSRPDGAIFKIISGSLLEAHSQSIATLTAIITLSRQYRPADLIFAVCRPFNQNLLGTFKSLAQLPRLLNPGGTVILFNEAADGAGDHHWRKKPEIVLDQKKYWSNIFKKLNVILYSPAASEKDFSCLFPGTFRLVKQFHELLEIIKLQRDPVVTVLPYAPITLIKSQPTSLNNWVNSPV